MRKSADAFRTISEVAEWLETPAHVLRFWESKFSQVKPVKRAGGRRYYRPTDMQLLGGIKKLLHEDGMTIKAVQKLLREKGVKHVAALSQPLDEVTEAEASGIAENVLPDDSALSGSVLTFPQSEPAPEPETQPDAAFAPEPETPAEADPPSEPEPEPTAAPEAAPDDQASPDPVPASEPSPASEPDPLPATAPAAEPPRMPSFMRRADEATPPQADATPEAASADAPPPPAITDVTVPDDPADDLPGEPGVLSLLAQTKAPVSPDLAQGLKALAERLKSTGS